MKSHLSNSIFNIANYLSRHSGFRFGIALLAMTISSVAQSQSPNSEISVGSVKSQHAHMGVRGYHKKISPKAGLYDLCVNESYIEVYGPGADPDRERESMGIDCSQGQPIVRFAHVSALTGSVYLSDKRRVPDELIEDDIAASLDNLHSTMNLGYFGRYYDDLRVPNSPKLIAISTTLNLTDNALLGLAVNNTDMLASDVVVTYHDEEYVVPHSVQPGEVFPFEINSNDTRISYGQVRLSYSLSQDVDLGRAVEILGYGLKGQRYENKSQISPHDALLLDTQLENIAEDSAVIVFSPGIRITLNSILAGGSSFNPPSQINDLVVVVAFFSEDGKVLSIVRPSIFLSDYVGDDQFYSLSTSLPLDKSSRFSFAGPDSDWAEYGIWAGGYTTH